MTDRHKHRPKAVRMPDGLLAWYEAEAKQREQSVNAMLVEALETFRDHARPRAVHAGHVSGAREDRLRQGGVLDGCGHSEPIQVDVLRCDIPGPHSSLHHDEEAAFWWQTALTGPAV